MGLVAEDQLSNSILDGFFPLCFIRLKHGFLSSPVDSPFPNPMFFFLSV